MKYSFIIADDFIKSFKPLLKKYPSLKDDFIALQKQIEENPKLGVNLGGGFKKIRINITSKGKGSSGGGRVITYEAIINVSESIITFVIIYNKGDFDSISISILKKNLGL